MRNDIAEVSEELDIFSFYWEGGHLSPAFFIAVIFPESST
jgi:hypothetical protein